MKLNGSTYDSYKDSEHRWIGQLPESWSYIPNKHLFKLKKNQVGKNAHKYDLLSLTLQGIIKRDMEKPQGKFPVEFDTYQEVKKGDFVFCLFDVEETPRAVGLSNFDGMITGAYTVLALKNEMCKEYFYYYYLNLDNKKKLKPLYKGLRNTIPKNSFFSLKSFVPPKPEQIAISNFLDEKTSKIDQAIAQKERMIELLKERKQIIIQNAVTKGLDPNVKMKDSGVEWIGEIPEHWEVLRLKYVVKILKRILGYEGPDVLSITQKGIKVKDIKSGEGQLAMNYSKYQIINKGEFGMNHMDLLTGYIDISKFDGVISPDYRVFVNVNKSISDAFLLLIFQFCYKQKILYKYGQGISKLGRWRLPAFNFNNFEIMIPDSGTQTKIMEFITEFDSKTQVAISGLLSQIEKLKEYKTTLIDHAVTGKIKVS